MAKTIPALLQAHYESRGLTTAVALRIDRADGQAYGFTSADEPHTFAGLAYEPGSLSASSFASSADMSVDNLELTAIDDGTLFLEPDIRGGRWTNARYQLFAYNWQSPGDGVEPLSAGTLGNITLNTGSILVELRGLQQYLQQPRGDITSRTCRARLGDGMCRVNLAGFTHTGTVTTATSSQAFTDSALTQAADYFGEGQIRWLTGANAGLLQKVKTHEAGGVFGLVLPMVYAVAVGDTFEAIAGCRKRLADCGGKFANVLNFQGEPHMQGVDSLTASPEPGGG